MERSPSIAVLSPNPFRKYVASAIREIYPAPGRLARPHPSIAWPTGTLAKLPLSASVSGLSR